MLYNRNGAVVFIIPAHAGKQVGFTGYYEDGRLRAQLPPLSHGSDTADSELPEFPAFATAHSRLYYPDGRLLALLPQDNAANGLILFYRADGSLLATINPDREPSVRLWDGAGTPLTEGTTAYQAATAELQPLLQQVKAMDRRVRQSRLEFSHGVRRNAQGVRVVAVSGIDVPLRVDNILPEAIRDADKAAKAENITYIAGEAQTFYYDADGKKTAQPAPGGYFRKLVGKTADGRIVAQDFYQDSGKPQTALFILRADAAADDFRTTDVFRAAMADSPVVTYGRTGAVYRVDYPVQADNTTHRTGVYHEGRLLAQHALLPGTRDPDDPLSELSALPDYYRYFYPDGRLQLLAMGEKRGDGIRAAYRDDGSLLMTRSTMADGGTETWWSADGMLLEEGTAAYRAAVQEYEML